MSPTPLRKTSAARVEGEPAEKAGMRADLLLVSAEGVPIVGEVKAATSTCSRHTPLAKVPKRPAPHHRRQ